MSREDWEVFDVIKAERKAERKEMTGLNWRTDKAPDDGQQILVEVTSGYYQVVSWWDDAWRENTNSMALRNPFKRWVQIEGTP